MLYYWTEWNYLEKNEWINEKGEIYLLYTKENISAMLGISETTIYRAFKQLEEIELIKQVRQGLNKPNKIFIGKIKHGFTWTCQICRSRPSKCVDQDISNTKPSETVFSEKGISENDIYVNLPIHDDIFLTYYLQALKHITGIEHKPVSEDNLSFIKNAIEAIKKWVDYETWQESVDEHLLNLPKNNDGSIMPFLKASMRYFEVHLDEAGCEY